MFKICNIAAQICFYQTHNLYKCISVIHSLFLGHWVHCFASIKHANQFHTSKQQTDIGNTISLVSSVN